MAASMSGALKAFIEGLGLSLSCFEDRPPESQLPPYAIIHPGVAKTPAVAQSTFDTSGSPDPIIETAQVSVWQVWKDGAGASAENRTLVDAVADGLDGSSLLKSGSGAPPWKVWGVVVTLVGPRLLDYEANLVHTPITIEIFRDRR
jgi:hypothetical protein